MAKRSSTKKTQASPTRPSVDEITREYASRRPIQEEFTGKTLELIKSLLRIQNIEVHLIESRTKGVDSFREKITRATKSYADPLQEITDFSGIRIIAYYEEDVQAVCQLLGNEFSIDWSNSSDKRATLRPEEFGYQSVHYVVSLSDTRRDLLEWKHLSQLKAEVQVRTVLQHAWAAISHKLQYKREGDVPPILRRRLFRLSALLELADEEFSSLRDVTAVVTQGIEEQIGKGLTNVDINIHSIEEFLKNSSVVDQLVEIARKISFYTLTPDDLDDYSSLVALCDRLGLTLISELERDIRTALKWVHSLLTKLSETMRVGWIVSPAFLCTIILIGKYPNQLRAEQLTSLGWDEQLASSTIRGAQAFANSEERQAIK